MVNYDWRCENPDCRMLEFEQRADSLIKVVCCPKCGGPARRMASAPPFKVQGGTPKFHK